jgi:hypothetical protein
MGAESAVIRHCALKLGNEIILWYAGVPVAVLSLISSSIELSVFAIVPSI